jgi:glutathione S-transferase
LSGTQKISTSLVIHHLGISQSERIIWLCEELGIPYTLKRYNRTRFARVAPPEYRALHPMGIAPVVEVDGRLLAESGAIVEYLVNRHGGGRLQLAVNDPGYADWLFWLHFANGTIMPTELMFTMLRAIPWSGYVRRALRPRRTHAFEMMDAHLAQVPWLAGAEFTTAEIMSAFAFSSMRHFSKTDIKPYPHIRAWLRRISERRGYQRAMAAGDPDIPSLLD